MARWRLAIHALDRTGPPMLALALARWIRCQHPDDELQVVAFRGGELEDSFAGTAHTEVVLEPDEPWDHSNPNPARTSQLRSRLAQLPEPDATLLVSIAGGQVLPLVDPSGPVITWVVEQGEDLHWLGPPVDVASHTDRWLAGSQSSRTELAARMGDHGAAETRVVHLAPGFISPPETSSPAVRKMRDRLTRGGEALVLGAGIATHRKAPDLFLEVALAHRRNHGPGARFVWIGGEADPLFPVLSNEIRRLGADHVTMLPTVADFDAAVAAADVFLHPARLDAFPLVCLHAAAAGTPVVAFSGCGGTQEMMGDSFIGSSYPDVSGLATHVAQLLDGRRTTELARGQQATVLANFVSEVAAQRVYGQLLAELRTGITS